MKLTDIFWEVPILEPYLKKAEAGTILFEQGTVASSCLIITRGILALLARKGDSLATINYIEAGSILGEQVLINDKSYGRAFGAKALSEVSYLEFDREGLKTLKQDQPELFGEILQKALWVSSVRINRLNALVSSLRSFNQTERFLQLVLYLVKYHSQTIYEGKEIVIHFETVNFYLELGPYQFEEMIQELENRNLLVRKAETVFVVPSESELQKMLPKLKNQIITMDYL